VSKFIYDEAEDYLLFEKIRKKNSKEFSAQTQYQELIVEQVTGSVHSVEDSKVSFNEIERDNFKEGRRPGAVSISPCPESNYTTEWVPFSTKMKNRREEEVVYLLAGIEKINKDCVALPRYREWFLCKSLSSRLFKLSVEKTTELIDKISNLRAED